MKKSFDAVRRKHQLFLRLQLRTSLGCRYAGETPQWTEVDAPTDGILILPGNYEIMISEGELMLTVENFRGYVIRCHRFKYTLEPGQTALASPDGKLCFDLLPQSGNVWQILHLMETSRPSRSRAGHHSGDRGGAALGSDLSFASKKSSAVGAKAAPSPDYARSKGAPRGSPSERATAARLGSLSLLGSVCDEEAHSRQRTHVLNEGLYSDHGTVTAEQLPKRDLSEKKQMQMVYATAAELVAAAAADAVQRSDGSGGSALKAAGKAAMTLFKSGNDHLVFGAIVERARAEAELPTAFETDMPLEMELDMPPMPTQAIGVAAPGVRAACSRGATFASKQPPRSPPRSPQRDAEGLSGWDVATDSTRASHAQLPHTAATERLPSASDKGQKKAAEGGSKGTKSTQAAKSGKGGGWRNSPLVVTATFVGNSVARFKVPDTFEAGQGISLRIPNGGRISVVLPASAQPGMSMQCQVDDCLGDGCSQTMSEKSLWTFEHQPIYAMIEDDSHDEERDASDGPAPAPASDASVLPRQLSIHEREMAHRQAVEMPRGVKLDAALAELAAPHSKLLATTMARHDATPRLPRVLVTSIEHYADTLEKGRKGAREQVRSAHSSSSSARLLNDSASTTDAVANAETNSDFNSNSNSVANLAAKASTNGGARLASVNGEDGMPMLAPSSRPASPVAADAQALRFSARPSMPSLLPVQPLPSLSPRVRAAAAKHHAKMRSEDELLNSRSESIASEMRATKARCLYDSARPVGYFPENHSNTSRCKALGVVAAARLATEPDGAARRGASTARGRLQTSSDAAAVDEKLRRILGSKLAEVEHDLIPVDKAGRTAHEHFEHIMEQFHHMSVR